MKQFKSVLQLVPEPQDTNSLIMRLTVTLYNTELDEEQIRVHNDFIALSSHMGYGEARKNHFATVLVKKSREARRMNSYDELEREIETYLRKYPRPYGHGA